MLGAVGVEAPPGLSGRSLIEPPAAQEAPVTYFEALMSNLSYGWAPLRGILQGSYKLISLPIPELYHLEDDPAELDNLFAWEPEQARALARQLPDESAWPPDPGEISEEERAALQSLGYLSGGGSSKSVFDEEDDPKNLVELDSKIQRAVQLYQQQLLDEAARLAREVI